MDEKEESKSNIKLAGYEFWKCSLNCAKYIVAPMVEHSELAWRMLSRQYGAQLCYTPMFHAGLFSTSEYYRKESLQTCDGDRPLIVQFCANDVDTLVRAAKLVESCCDAVDLNLGCPQSIAKRGHYGAFLDNDWTLLQAMISKCHEVLSVPITCKIRIFDDIQTSVDYAKMLVDAGCQLLTVHGRTKEQKGINTGLASWEHIKAIKSSINVPVFANGNIQYLDDVERCLVETGVDGVMSAEGNLHNPAIFTGQTLPNWQLAEEYLHYVSLYPCTRSIIKGHLFKLFHHSLQIHKQFRDELATASDMKEFVSITARIKAQLLLDKEADDSINPSPSKLPYPHWLCQPYVRPSPTDEGTKRDDEAIKKREQIKRQLEELSQNSIYNHLSKKKLRKILRNPRRSLLLERKSGDMNKYVYCSECANPRPANCTYKLCKPCCKSKSNKDVARCCEVVNHRCSTCKPNG